MPNPQIDLSAGLVPKVQSSNTGNIDLSAGLVSQTQAQPPESTGFFSGVARGAKNLIHMPKAAYDAMTAPPANDDEKVMLSTSGPVGLAFHRMVVEPSIREYQKGEQEHEKAVQAGVPQFGDPGNTGHPFLDNTIGRFVDMGDKPTNPA